MHPNRGAQSGGTYVVLTGSGFSAGPVTVQFGQGAARDVRVINDNTISLRTPANLPGTVDVTVSVGGDSETLALAFTYFDPAFINGGSHGGDVEGAVNVTVYGVLMGQMIPQGALVYLGLESGHLTGYKWGRAGRQAGRHSRSSDGDRDAEHVHERNRCGVGGCRCHFDSLLFYPFRWRRWRWPFNFILACKVQ